MNDISAPDYKTTVFLPRTEFPMRGDLPTREPATLRRWEAMGLWARLRAAAKGRKSFILHDGPPYANGNLHIGHALNKIHKDVINRAQQMAGRDANYIPGWDCHGLPIEWKVEETYRKKNKNKDDVPVLEFRRECREYAQHWLDVQAEEFKRLGVAGDWANRYATMDFASEAAIAGEIGKFLLNGALYRGLRPVMWSPVEKTSLAEAEVEYHDKKDTAIHVRFPIAEADAGDLADAAIVIWTTTPWTIPGNRGLAAGAEFDYALITVDAVAENSLARIGEKLIVAEALLADFLQQTGITAHRVLRLFKGAELKGKKFHHPLATQDAGYAFAVPVMLGDFVTTEAGTGIVHMAPGHGEDDFFLCRANGIAVPDTVQGDGTYYPSVPLFAGVHVYKAADPVCAALAAAGTLLHRNEFVHSYPHSWRSKAPLIYRATPNWFIRMDGPENIREQALAAIDGTSFVPEIGRNRIRSMVESRPDWCISRQRAWGVPIAIFVSKTTHEPLRDPEIVARVVDIFTQEGADAWYARPAQDFLGANTTPRITNRSSTSSMSGSNPAQPMPSCSKPAACRPRPISTSKARTSIAAGSRPRSWNPSATRGIAPFKAIVTDGFVLDEQGRKMSKSLGNVTAPQEVNDKYGADILRLWVMNSDTSEDLRIGPEILKQQAELYRRLRNTLRWILGSLDGFTEAEKLPEQEFPELEQFLLHRLSELNAKIADAVQSHDWTGVYPALHHFCATDLSAFYFDIRKDSLVLRPPGCQKTPRQPQLSGYPAPLPDRLAGAGPALHGGRGMDHAFRRRELGAPDPVPGNPGNWRNDALAETWTKIREHRSAITGAIELMRRDKTIGSSLQAKAVLAPEAREISDAISKPGPISASPPAPSPAPKMVRWSRTAPNANAAGASCPKSAPTPNTRPSASAAARLSDHERASRHGQCHDKA